ncbi:hypothetical protein Zmor_019509 [Zophobas morio]|uniref:Uncharacterized protein n=1 Tax=Zophobas morio TaxID=2755281 RepID=A0AA38I220_9CUCU|nr:hypothetical protein Zmor_019509 [Zophobas morio]
MKNGDCDDQKRTGRKREIAYVLDSGHGGIVTSNLSWVWINSQLKGDGDVGELRRNLKTNFYFGRKEFR